jgi:hypothetical protein
VKVDEVLDLEDHPGQDRPVHAHAAAEDLVGATVVGALLSWAKS